MVTAEAEAAALDCDGSLTDDDDDGPFVLTDPATLVAERHESTDESCRPTRRRRTSIEMDNKADGVVVHEQLISSLAAAAAPPTLFVHQATSPSSHVGMAFLCDEPVNSFVNVRSRQQLSNRKIVSSGSSKSTNFTAEDVPKVSDGAMYRVKSKESIKSVGLDREPSSLELKKGGNTPIAERDLHTPPVTQDELESPQLFSGRSIQDQLSENYFERKQGKPVSIYFSRSGPGHVHRTIASLVAQEQEHSSPVVCKS
jgi:hypothetical protein